MKTIYYVDKLFEALNKGLDPDGLREQYTKIIEELIKERDEYHASRSQGLHTGGFVKEVEQIDRQQSIIHSLTNEARFDPEDKIETL